MRSRSIRWRLQAWYGLILLIVLTGFGLTAYHLERATQLRHVDEELQRHVSVLVSSMRRPEGGRPGGERPPPPRFGPRPDGMERGFEGSRPYDESFPDGPPERRFGPPPDEGPEPGFSPPDRAGEGPGNRPPPLIRLSRENASLFDGGKTNALYYVVWRRTGEEVIRSAAAPEDMPIPVRREALDLSSTRSRGLLREAFHFTPPGECLLVGRSMAGELAELRRLRWWLSLVGGGVLLMGLAGGGWLAARTIRPIEDISATAVKIAAGDLSQRINVADTDTELGRLAGVLNSTFARLDAAFSQQGRFTSDAAHELRTPVSVILTQTQTALSRDRTAVEFRKTVEACQRAAQRMRRLIESLLELARIDSGQEPMKRMPFDIGQAIWESVEMVRPLAAEREIEIHFEPRVLNCIGDPERIGQVITNLLTNAIHYNKERGTVRIETESKSGMVAIRVEDAGAGIPEDDLPHIFERFYRVDKSRSGSAGHSGLGLAITKAIVEAHGGNVEVASELGVGSVFVVRLPAE